MKGAKVWLLLPLIRQILLAKHTGLFVVSFCLDLYLNNQLFGNAGLKLIAIATFTVYWYRPI